MIRHQHSKNWLDSALYDKLESCQFLFVLMIFMVWLTPFWQGQASEEFNKQHSWKVLKLYSYHTHTTNDFIKNILYRLNLASRGGVIKSWRCLTSFLHLLKRRSYRFIIIRSILCCPWMQPRKYFSGHINFSNITWRNKFYND